MPVRVAWFRALFLFVQSSSVRIIHDRAFPSLYIFYAAGNFFCAFFKPKSVCIGCMDFVCGSCCRKVNVRTVYTPVLYCSVCDERDSIQSATIAPLQQRICLRAVTIDLIYSAARGTSSDATLKQYARGLLDAI